MGRTTLRADRIAETADTLTRRIKERFPDSGLAVLSDELCDLEILCDGLSRKVWQKMGMAEDISDHPIDKRVQ